MFRYFDKKYVDWSREPLPEELLENQKAKYIFGGSTEIKLKQVESEKE